MNYEQFFLITIFLLSDYLNEVLHEQGEDEDTLTMDKPIEFSTKKPNGCDKPSDMSIIMGTTNKEDFDCPITFTAKSPSMWKNQII